MRIIANLSLIVLLAGCGADGEPVTPTMNGHIGISNGGLFGSASVGVSTGPVTATVGTGRGCLYCW